MKKWDIFISHASEDKEEIVLPLYNFFKRAGIRVWLDSTEMKIGDSLLEKIETGLAESRFGVVIISEHFLQKEWPRKELNELFTLEENGQKLILPVWHKVEEKNIVKDLPNLANKLAGSTKHGVEKLGEELLKTILNPSNKSPVLSNPTVPYLFNQLLEAKPDPSSIKDFLKIHKTIIVGALGLDSEKTKLQWDVEFPGGTADLVVAELQMTSQTKRFFLVTFLSPDFSVETFPDAETYLDNRVKNITNLRKWLSINIAKARQIIPDIRPDYEAVFYIGRRNSLGETANNWIKDYNASSPLATIRTYDKLIDSIK